MEKRKKHEKRILFYMKWMRTRVQSSNAQKNRENEHQHGT